MLAFAGTLLLAVLISARAQRTVLSTAVRFLVAGFVLGWSGLDLGTEDAPGHPLVARTAELLKLAALLLFGAVVSRDLLIGASAGSLAFAALAILAVRPVALAFALVGGSLGRREWITAAWFGPKGFASVVYGLLILRWHIARRRAVPSDRAGSHRRHRRSLLGIAVATLEGWSPYALERQPRRLAAAAKTAPHRWDWVMSRSRPDARSLHRRFLLVAGVLIATSGWRLGRLNVAWVAFGALSLATAQLLIDLGDPRCSLSFFAFTLLFYYGGNTLLLRSNLPARMITRWGEDRAYRVYETILGVMFINQGLGLACVGSLALGPRWLLPGSPGLLWITGAALCCVGIIVKVWATLVVGVDAYYYRDMFLGRPVSTFVAGGPYRVLRNPMYGVGQLHAYGVAVLMSRAWSGLMAAAVCHALIYVFYFAVELPFIRRTYFTRASH